MLLRLKKFTYDIWGDAVNMAARMEQHGEAGKINISGNTYQLIKDKGGNVFCGGCDLKDSLMKPANYHTHTSLAFAE